MNRLLTAFAVVSTLGSSAYAQPVNVTLRLSERLPVAELAANVNDPTSPRYGKFYTPEEIRAISGPTDAQYNQLLTQLRADGFTVVSETKTHLFVTVKADHQQLEKLFKVSIKFGGANLATRTVDATPTIPAKYSLVESVVGLDNSHKRHPRHTLGKPVMANDASGQPGILPSQVKTAYKLDGIYSAGINGTGQNIAIATYMGFYIQDIQDYYKMEGLSPAPTVDQVQFNGNPAFDDDSAAETQLDAEFSGMIAPGVAVHVFASAENSDAGEVAIFTAILDDNRSKIANYSWGECETTIDQTTPTHQADMDKLYTQAVAQGINIQVASGDSGSDGCGDGTNVADWPASQPNVVAVGGTTLTLNSDNSIQSEVGWSDGGGGVSGIYASPSYQSALPAPYNAHRSFPDVSFNADPMSGEAIWTHYQNTVAAWVPIGGTSMAAPQWSGFLTLVNAARVAAGKSTLPFADPLLYPAAQGSQYGSLFNDATSGNNGEYSAGTGWDAVTGWGSMQGQALLTYLVAQ